MSPLLQTFANASVRGWNVPNGFSSSYELISTSILSSTQTSVTFASIPSNYKHLQLRFVQVAPAGGAGASISITLNSVGGSSYAWHWLVGTGSAVQSGGTTSQAYMKIFGQVVGTDTVKPTSGILDLLDYTSTTKNKTVRTFAGIASGEVSLHSGLFMNTNLIDTLNVAINAAAGSRFSLYGIKG